MTLDLTKPVQTRDGRAVRILATDIKSDAPIVAAIQIFKNDEKVYCYKANGNLLGSIYENLLDLVNVPETKWMNVYLDKDKPGSHPYVGNVPWDTKEQAVKYGQGGRGGRGIVCLTTFEIEV